MLLSVEDLHVGYGAIEALHGVTFEVKEGEMVTLIGANGAGKSTTLMSIMRLPPPEAPAYRSGKMSFVCVDAPARLPATRRASCRHIHGHGERPSTARDAYARLSPFHPLARNTIREIYEDLGRHAPFRGILFHDDATLSDFEDASPWASEFYAREWGLPDAVDAIRADPAAAARWAERKTTALIDFTREILDRVGAYRSPLRSARNLFAAPVLDPRAEAWFAQSLPSFLAAYDQTAVMAMPYLERAKDPLAWLDTLVAHVRAQPNGLEKVIFELQATDWRTDQAISAGELARWMRRLQLGGALNFGYYPDDFSQDRPGLDAIRPAMSLRVDFE